MSNLVKCQYAALRLDGRNYFEWALETTLHLRSQNLGEVIKDENTESLQDKSKAIIFIRHHMDHGLRGEYLDIQDPLDLWNRLKERFEHMKQIAHPQALYDWSNLRLQDFKSVNEYNSAIFKIVSRLRMCGEKITDDSMLEKTFSTFHPSNMLLQQQYRERKFQKFTELIACLLVAEQNNELLLKNHQARPVGSTPFPEVNVTGYDGSSRPMRVRGPRRGRGRGRGRGYGRNNFQPNGRNNKVYHQKWNKYERHEKGKGPQNQAPRGAESTCYRCGGTGHWSRNCREKQYFVESVKGKKKTVETNFIDRTDPVDPIKLTVSDFFEDDDGNTSRGENMA
jgi:hypothetical protein